MTLMQDGLDGQEATVRVFNEPCGLPYSDSDG